MRVKQPEIFDPKREYKPGERAIYKGMVIIAEIWTKAAQRLADDPGLPETEYGRKHGQSMGVVRP